MCMHGPLPVCLCLNACWACYYCHYLTHPFKPSDIQPGSEYRIELQSRLGTNWWTFEDEAEGKKFFEGMLPNQYGSWDAKATGPEACEKHYSEGWIYSYPLFDLKFTVNGNQQAVIKFVD